MNQSDYFKSHSKKSRKLCSFISIVLTLTLILQTFFAAGVPVFASETPDLSTFPDGSGPNLTVGGNSYANAVDIQNISDSNIVGEIEDRREESTKYFRLTDGTVLATTYDSPVHKLDANGKWQEINFLLTDNGTEYENTENSMEIKFSKNPKNGKLYTLKTDEGQIKWSLLGVKESVKEAKLTQTSEKPNKLAVINTSGCVSYENILPGVTLQYWATEGQLKENIIFADTESAQPLQFELQTNKFELTLEDNVIYFFNAGGEKVYSMSAPWMMDSNGITSDAVTLSLSGTKNHYTVTVTPDAEWLKTAAYPVTVDPILCALTKDPSGVADENLKIKCTYVESAHPNERHYGYGSITVGREQSTYQNARAAVRFDLPTTVDSSDRVIAASLQLTLREFKPQSTQPIIVNVHKITADLGISTLTWNTLNGNYSPVVTDSQVITAADAASYKLVPFDITTAVRDWYQNGGNYGIAFVSENEDTAYRCVNFFTHHNTAVSSINYPVLFVQYANNNGLEDNLTYHTAGNGETGVVSVNDFNGNLVYMFEDASTNGNLFPVSVSHVYDNARRNEADTDNNQGNTYFGKGFRLNLYERILPETDLNDYPYKYIDADGTWHYFKVKDADANLYVDEFYPNRVLEKINNSEGTLESFKLTDGSNFETVFTSDGYLNYKKDILNGKTANVYYIEGTKHIDKITDGADKVIDFTYTTIDGKTYLQSVTDTSGRLTTYAYSNGMLTSITRPGNRTVTITYDSNNSIARIKSYDNSSVNMTYYSNAYNSTDSLRRVHTLLEKGTDGSEGQKLTFVYNTGETTVTDRSGKTETMMFDDFGQTVCVRDNEGRATFLKYQAPDATNDVHPGKADNDDKAVSKATQLEYSTKLQSTVNNYVANHNFEDSTLNNWATDNNICTGIGGGIVTTDQAFMGNRSLKVRSTSQTGLIGSSQDVSLPDMSAGSVYTLSAYVKVSAVSLASGVSSSGAAVYFGYRCSDGTWNMEAGEFVQTVGDWKRVSVTATLPENVTSVFVLLGLVNCTGTVCFDNVQVEKGSVANSYNMVDNGDFGDAVGATTLHDYAGENLTTSDMVVNIDGRNCFVINGDRRTAKNINQTIDVSGTAGDKYSFGAWAKSTGALSERGSLNDETRDFHVRISFRDANGEWSHNSFKFESKTTNWQFLAGEAVADKDYTAVQIAVLYNYQKNAAYFDDLSLFKEGSNTRYTYDSWGRIETVQAVDKSENEVTRYTYVVEAPAEDAEDTETEVDNRVARIDYPDGTYEIYEYYRNKQLAHHVDANQVRTSYYYDSKGNLESQSVLDNTGRTSDVLVGSTTTYTADGNYAVSSTDPFDNTSYTHINTASGLLEYATDAKGTRTNYTYNPYTDAITKVTTGDSEVNYGYTNHKLTSIEHKNSDTKSTTYNFTYDVFGNTDTISVGNRVLINHDYAPNNGNLIKSTYGNGFYTENIYDSLDRVVGIKYNGVKKFGWDFNYKGQVGLHTDLVNNQTFSYTYDSAGRLLNVVGKSSGNMPNINFTNTFNEDGKLTAVNRKVGSTSLQMQYNYSDGGRLLNEVFNNGNTQHYTYDALGRVSEKTVKTSAGAGVLTNSYTFRAGAETDTTTAMISTETLSGNGWSNTYGYTYDANGNITEITKDGEVYATYTYDDLNQLTGAVIDGTTYAYTYDDGGNILSMQINGYTMNFGYNNSEWSDLLTSYGSWGILYDEIGNPEYYKDMQLEWEGRQLKIIEKGASSLSFAYNADGIRTQKSYNGTKTYFTLDGDRIVSQKTDNNEIFFEYDAVGQVKSLIYNGNTYYYVRNTLGDILGLTDASGNMLVSYVYDPWGYCEDVIDNSGFNLSTLNPFRYKGYYYDTETKLYYCNSRYYDPEIGRFINADGVVSGTGESVHGYNLFAYCFNNPINLDDANGNWPKWAKKIVAAVAVVAVVAVVATVAVATCGAGSVIACAAVGAAKGAAVGLVTGAVSGAATSAVEHRLQTGSWEGAGEAALNGMGDGALSGAISGAVTGSLTSNACFVAGTSVLTSVGYVAIENIQSGDYVWATDPDTGETELKEVVQTFVNDAHELVYVYINGEVIKCTNEHPFYSPVRGWTAACDLRAGDVLVLVNGEYVVVERVEHYILESPIKVYNFEVAGFHTYYVGEQSVLVHNMCKPKGRTGKQVKLKELANDDKLSSALRGEIKRDMNQIARGKRKTIRVPQGYNLAHNIGYSAKDGYGYAYSQLQPIAMHILHHKIFGYK